MRNSCCYAVDTVMIFIALMIDATVIPVIDPPLIVPP